MQVMNLSREQTMNTIVQMENVWMRYAQGQPWAVENLSLEVVQGETLSLLGPSGCGKTSTLRLIAGFEVPQRGTIRIGGKAVAGEEEWKPPERREVGMVFQDLALFPHLTVGKNVAFGLSGWEIEKRKNRVNEVLELVNLSGFPNRYPHELSGGQQQRVALARALAPSPQLILLDEPFSGLDADMRLQVRREVKDILNRSGLTAIFVTHDQVEAFDLSDNVAVMNRGRIDQVGNPENLYHHPESLFVARFLGLADLVPGKIWNERVHTALGNFLYSPNDSLLSEGTPVEAIIRPADVDIIPSADGEASVVARHFRGSDNLYTIALPSGERVRSQTPWNFILELGSRVTITVEPMRVVVFPSDIQDGEEAKF